MSIANGQDMRALFQARTEDGSHWLFVVLSDDRWMITRDGKEIAIGSKYRTSINHGVEKFMSLTRAVATTNASRDAEVGALLDRIERCRALEAKPSGPHHGRSRVVKVGKSQGRIGPYVPEESSALLTTYGTAAP